MKSYFQNKKICKKKRKSSSVDLSDLRLPTRKSEYYKSKLPKKIYYGNFILIKKKFIDEGSYGKVYLYSTKNNKIQVALKITVDQQEKTIINKINKNQLKCPGIMETFVLKNPYFSDAFFLEDNFYIAMEYLDGDLHKFDTLRKIKETVSFEMIVAIATQLSCLTKLRLYYMDIKDKNILYKCSGKNEFKVSLADFGSIYRINEKASCSYPPPEDSSHPKFSLATEKGMIWGLGLLALKLRKVNLYEFNWSNIKNMNKLYGYKNMKSEIFSQEKINQLIDKEYKDSKINKIIKSCLMVDKTKRISFNKFFKENSKLSK